MESIKIALTLPLGDAGGKHKDERSVHRKRKQSGRSFNKTKTSKVVLASQPSFGFLPDSIALRIMALLDILSLFSLSQVNRRYYLLHSDEFIWTDVDLSTIPRLNVHTVKKLVCNKLHPRLWRLILRSNAVECQRKHKLRPALTSSSLDDIFRRCPTIRNITLLNCDLSQLSGDCLLWSNTYLERVTFSSCIAPFRWLEQVKPRWPSLKHLYLPYTNKTSDHDILYLATMKEKWGESAFDLRHLSIRRCSRVGQVSIKSLCDSFSNLLTLDISECSYVTPDCLFLIAEHMLQLRDLNISNCSFMNSVEDANNLLSRLHSNCIYLRVLTVCAAQLYMDENLCSESNDDRLNHIHFKIDFVTVRLVYSNCSTKT